MKWYDIKGLSNSITKEMKAGVLNYCDVIEILTNTNDTVELYDKPSDTVYKLEYYEHSPNPIMAEIPHSSIRLSPARILECNLRITQNEKISFKEFVFNLHSSDVDNENIKFVQDGRLWIEDEYNNICKVNQVVVYNNIKSFDFFNEKNDYYLSPDKWRPISKSEAKSSLEVLNNLYGMDDNE